jgi:serine/threonine-protein kinase
LRAPRIPGAVATPRAADSPRPDRLGPWVLVDEAGSGEFCRVFRAKPADCSFDALANYAVKVLKPEYEGDARAIGLLRREGRVGRAIASPHVVVVLDAQTTRAPYYLVMPWLEGRALSTVLAETGAAPIATPLALWIARQLAEALAALDRAGWMHADVKPANVMVSQAGHATLVDLGLARRPMDEDQTLLREIVGTPWYMAPEVLLSTGRPDIRSDLYSLGVMLYEMLSGRLPFDFTDTAELIAAHRAEKVIPLREIAPQISSGVAQLVHGLLAKDPFRRPQSPEEILPELISLEIQHFGEFVARDA